MHMRSFFEGVSREKPPEWEVSLRYLSDPDPETQRDAAQHLKACVEVALRELSTDSFDHFESIVHKRVFALLNETVSNVVVAKIGSTRPQLLFSTTFLCSSWSCKTCCTTH